jgi:hypothetical protein
VDAGVPDESAVEKVIEADSNIEKNDCCMPWRRRKAASFIHYQTKQKQQHITKNLKLLTLHQSNFYYIAYKKRTNQHY